MMSIHCEHSELSRRSITEILTIQIGGSFVIVIVIFVRWWNEEVMIRYRTTDHERRLRTEIDEVERNLHPRVTAAHNEDFFALELCTALVLAGVEHAAGGEILHPWKGREDGFCVFTGCNHQPLSSNLSRMHVTTTTRCIYHVG